MTKISENQSNKEKKPEEKSKEISSKNATEEMYVSPIKHHPHHEHKNNPEHIQHQHAKHSHSNNSQHEKKEHEKTHVNQPHQAHVQHSQNHVPHQTQHPSPHHVTHKEAPHTTLHTAHHLNHRINHAQNAPSQNIQPKTPIKRGEILESYEISVDGASVNINIEKRENGTIYDLQVPEINSATAALLNEVHSELVTFTTVSMKELTDPESFNVIKDRFLNDATALIKAKLPNIEKKVESFLVGILMQEMLGLGRIEFMISDPNLEEIVVPSAREPVRVYSKKYGWLETSLTIEREEEIINYANIIARRVGRQITVLNPMLDARLTTGDRINAVLYPINSKGNTITIRKFARDPFTILDFINNKTCDSQIAALLWLGVEYEMNILISGGTGSGKTSFLNACLAFIPPNQRIVSIEDTRELALPDFLYWTPLITRTPNPEGKGEVSMLDLLVNSLRMRPDRIILGEMRRKDEATVLFEAMHTGHSVYATVHADSAIETISRLVNPPISVPPNMLRAVNLNLVMIRDRRKGTRRILQIAEFEADKNDATANIIFRRMQEEDRLVKHRESNRLYEDIERRTGMSQQEIEKDIEGKKQILDWLVGKKIRSLKDFGKVLNLYYRNRSQLTEAMKKDDVNLILNEEK